MVDINCSGIWSEIMTEIPINRGQASIQLALQWPDDVQQMTEMDLLCKKILWMQSPVVHELHRMDINYSKESTATDRLSFSHYHLKTHTHTQPLNGPLSPVKGK